MGTFYTNKYINKYALVGCKLTKLIGTARKFELPALRDVLKYGLFLRRTEENDNN